MKDVCVQSMVKCVDESPVLVYFTSSVGVARYGQGGVAAPP